MHDIAAIALFLLLCTAGVDVSGQNRPDDELLLVVGKSQLKESRRIRCVTGHYLGDDRFGEISDWLFQQLRRQRKSLTRCSNDSSFEFDTGLLVGPVVWLTPTMADAYFGPPGGVISRDGYRAERDASGRWWFTRLTRE